MTEREQWITDTFIELADTLSRDYDVGDFLHLLVERCGKILEVTTAGVLVESADGTLRLAAATSPEMQALEEAEIEHREGPCLEAYLSGEQVSATQLVDQFGRWPNIAPIAVDMGLSSVHAFPLRLRDDRIGALNLYQDEASALGPRDVPLAQAFADIASIGILQERKVAAAEERSAQLQQALDSRLLIERAKGTLAEREQITATEAFHRIRAHARSRSQKVHEVCAQVVDSGFVPD